MLKNANKKIKLPQKTIKRRIKNNKDIHKQTRKNDRDSYLSNKHKETFLPQPNAGRQKICFCPMATAADVCAEQGDLTGKVFLVTWPARFSILICLALLR